MILLKNSPIQPSKPLMKKHLLMKTNLKLF